MNSGVGLISVDIQEASADIAKLGVPRLGDVTVFIVSRADSSLLADLEQQLSTLLSVRPVQTAVIIVTTDSHFEALRECIDTVLKSVDLPTLGGATTGVSDWLGKEPMKALLEDISDYLSSEAQELKLGRGMVASLSVEAQPPSEDLNRRSERRALLVVGGLLLVAAVVVCFWLIASRANLTVHTDDWVGNLAGLSGYREVHSGAPQSTSTDRNLVKTDGTAAARVESLAEGSADLITLSLGELESLVGTEPFLAVEHPVVLFVGSYSLGGHSILIDAKVLKQFARDVEKTILVSSGEDPALEVCRDVLEARGWVAEMDPDSAEFGGARLPRKAAISLREPQLSRFIGQPDVVELCSTARGPRRAAFLFITTMRVLRSKREDIYRFTRNWFASVALMRQEEDGFARVGQEVVGRWLSTAGSSDSSGRLVADVTLSLRDRVGFFDLDESRAFLASLSEPWIDNLLDDPEVGILLDQIQKEPSLLYQNSITYQEKLKVQEDFAAYQESLLEVRPVLGWESSFTSGSGEISPEIQSDLARRCTVMRRFLGAFPEVGVLIQGFADSTGSAEFNMLKSRERASAVRLEMRECGVMSSRIRSVGCGETDSVTGTNWAHSRLARIFLVEMSQLEKLDRNGGCDGYTQGS